MRGTPNHIPELQKQVDAMAKMRNITELLQGRSLRVSEGMCMFIRMYVYTCAMCMCMYMCMHKHMHKHMAFYHSTNSTMYYLYYGVYATTVDDYRIAGYFRGVPIFVIFVTQRKTRNFPPPKITTPPKDTVTCAAQEARPSVASDL